MSKKAKIWLIIASSLVLVGCVIFAGAMSALNWDFKKLSTVTYETSSLEFTKDYKNISIITNTADVQFMPSESNKTSITLYEQKNLKHSVSVENNILSVKLIDTRKWYDYIGISFGTPKITIYLPKADYSTLLIKGSTGNVKLPEDYKFKKVNIRLSTGDINLESVSVNDLDLSVSTGSITLSSIDCEGDISIDVSTGRAKLSDVKCQNLISDGDTGDILLKNVIAKKKILIERDTGDVRFDGVDATEIQVETDTGDVKGTLLSDKVFITETDTGYIDVPKTVTGGKCEITTDTGDIKISIK